MAKEILSIPEEHLKDVEELDYLELEKEKYPEMWNGIEISKEKIDLDGDLPIPEINDTISNKRAKIKGLMLGDKIWVDEGFKPKSYITRIHRVENGKYYFFYKDNERYIEYDDQYKWN